MINAIRLARFSLTLDPSPEGRRKKSPSPPGRRVGMRETILSYFYEPRWTSVSVKLLLPPRKSRGVSR
jgi:hypothetical protein